MIKKAKCSAQGLAGRKPSGNLSAYLVEQSKAHRRKENQKFNCFDPGASYGSCSERVRVRVGWWLPSPAQDWK